MQKMLQGLSGKQRRWYYAVLVSTVILTLWAVYIAVSYAINGSLTFGLLIAAICAVGLFLTASGLFSIIRGDSGKTVSNVVRIAVGAHIVLPLFFALLVFSFSKMYYAKAKVIIHDYTADIEIIDSVSVIQSEKSIYGNMIADDFQYRTLCNIDKTEWLSIFNELKEFEFRRPFGDPRGISKGSKLIMIRYIGPNDGVVYEIVGQICSAQAVCDANGSLRLHTDSCNTEDYKEFNAFIERLCAE